MQLLRSHIPALTGTPKYVETNKNIIPGLDDANLPMLTRKRFLRVSFNEYAIRTHPQDR